MALQRSKEGDSAITEWVPQQSLRMLDPMEIKYSRGFMRSRPEKWFPGFAAHWLTLGHSLGVEMQVSEVKPALRAARTLGLAFLGSVLGERIMLFADSESMRVILSSIVPGSGEDAEEIVLEYLARRFMVSLGLSWSGPESSKVTFQGKADTLDMHEAGAVKLSFTLNSQFCSLWLLLGQSMVDQLDRLWRKQIKSSNRIAEESQEIKFEVAHSYLSRSDLNESLRVGAYMQFDAPLPEYITLRRGERGWLPGRLALSNGNFVAEVLAAPLLESPGPETSARVSVCLGSIDAEGSSLSEISQPGAVVESSIRASNMAEILVDDEPAAKGEIVLQNGRMALRVSEL